MSPHPRTAGSVAGPPAHAPCPANPTAAHAARSANLPQRPPGCHRPSPQDILIARRGSTVKLALMGMPPEGVLAVVCLDNPRDNTRGKALWASLPLLGPGGMPTAFVRCYTGTDGQSHFEDLDLLPPDMERSIEQAVSNITFTRSPNGRFSDWHNAPRRQYAIFLSGGQMEVVIGDGA